jgi:hypothetical protein
MNFLVGNHGPRNQDWLDLFEVVIVGSRKPAFLEDRSAYMMRVVPADGSLRNVDGVEEPVDEFLAAGKVFQGGNWKYLLEMLKLKSGDNVLYVGDHMYRSVGREGRSDGRKAVHVESSILSNLPYPPSVPPSLTSFLSPSSVIF